MPDTKPEVKSEIKSEVKPETEKVVIKKRGPIKKLFVSFVDVKKWFSYDEVSANTKTTLGLFRRLFSRGQAGVRQETYAEATVRLGLTEAQQLTRKNNFLYSAMVYGAFAVGFFIYFLYMLFNLRFLAAGLTVILVILMVLAAYREHFWYMQMQKKKLGCNFDDWLAFILRRS